MKRVINDPAVDARFPSQNTRPPGAAARLDSEPFKAIEAANTRIYNVPTLPTMSTFATDMAQLRARGMQCYGIGPAVDLEDGPKGFGMHSDQERLLESGAVSLRTVQLRGCGRSGACAVSGTEGWGLGAGH